MHADWRGILKRSDLCQETAIDVICSMTTTTAVIVAVDSIFATDVADPAAVRITVGC